MAICQSRCWSLYNTLLLRVKILRIGDRNINSKFNSREFASEVDVIRRENEIRLVLRPFWTRVAADR